MLLSDKDILQEIRWHGLQIDRLSDGAIGPASIDLILSNHFHRFSDTNMLDPIDPKQDNSMDGREEFIKDGGFFLLQPGGFALASTRERFVFPSHLGGRLEGKSSLGRLGLMTHVTAGFFDPGFEGWPTLELVNLRKRSIRLYPGMPIAQMSIFSMVSATETPYGSKKNSKYAGQGEKPAPSMYHLNF